MKGLALASILTLCLVPALAHGTVIINPSNPTTSSWIWVTTEGLWPDTSYELNHQTVSVSGNTVNVRFDVDKGFMGFAVMTPFSYSALLGQLPVGTYQVNSSLYVTSMDGGLGLPGSPQYLGTESTSFSVTPEPASLSLLALGGLLVARRRRTQ